MVWIILCGNRNRGRCLRLTRCTWALIAWHLASKIIAGNYLRRCQSVDDRLFYLLLPTTSRLPNLNVLGVFLLSFPATFHWPRLATGDWTDCLCTVLSFRPHKLPHTDTGYVQRSFFCLLIFKEHQWSSQSFHLQDWPHGLSFLFFFLFLSHSLAEIMTSRTVFVRGAHMTRLLAPYLSCHALVTKPRTRWNGASSYKQPNVKFMPGGICVSVINYQHWLKVKRRKEQL